MNNDWKQMLKETLSLCSSVAETDYFAMAPAPDDGRNF
jgi:hypothetical protein